MDGDVLEGREKHDVILYGVRIRDRVSGSNSPLEGAGRVFEELTGTFEWKDAQVICSAGAWLRCVYGRKLALALL